MSEPLFKTDKQRDELPLLHPKLPKILSAIVTIHDVLGWDTEVTSCVRRPDEIPGESNVHATGRAFDCVARHRSDGCKVPVVEVAPMIAKLLNAKFPRQDQFSSVLWHSAGYGFHYHVQVPFDPAYKELGGIVPVRGDKF